MAKKTKDDGFRFEEGLARLEGLVGELETGELGLEESIRKYEEGMLLYRACAGRLETAKRRIEVLLASPDGTERTEAFDDGHPGTPEDRG